MKYGLYSIKDLVAEEFSPVSMHKNDGTAYRAFLKTLADLPNEQDFKLFRVGMFDTDDGLINQEKQRIVIDYRDLEEEQF